MKKEEVPREYSVIGFRSAGDEIIFMVKDKYIYIKATLPTAFLVSKLNISPFLIDKHLKNCILEEARAKGRVQLVYSVDSIHFQEKYIEYLKNGEKSTQKYVPITEVYPYQISKGEPGSVQ